jgi:signal peptidase II
MLGDTVRLQATHNEGAFLSLGSSLPKNLRQALFTGGVAVVLLAMLGYSLFARPLSRVSIVAITLVVGGGISNLADRLVHDGRVFDFINIGIGPLRTGIFNVADVCITVGILVLLAESFIGKSSR